MRDNILVFAVLVQKSARNHAKLGKAELFVQRERTRVEWVSAAEGAKFAATMNDFVEKVTALGENKRLEDLRCKK